MSSIIDNALDSAKYVINPEEKVIFVDDEHEMITLGYANHTPWNSPRETDEDVLEKKIEVMCSKVSDMKKCIFNLHVPPINTIRRLISQTGRDVKARNFWGAVADDSAGVGDQKNGGEIPAAHRHARPHSRIQGCRQDWKNHVFQPG